MKPLFVLLLSATSLTPAFAQDAPASPPAEAQAEAEPQAAAAADQMEQDAESDPESDEMLDGEEILVTGQRPRGSVVGDVQPEIQLGPRDIRAVGASNVAELLDALAPQTGSTRGRGGGGPVTLLNGRRISSFAEIRDIPPEAISRVEILPEEVALNYGYRADQRVVNIVLRRRFRAITTEVEAGLPTAGGRFGNEFDVNMLRIDADGRWSLDAEYERDSMLLESERDIIPSEASRPFAIGGNIGASPFVAGGEVDPALSAAVGQTVTVAGVPAVAASGPATLAAFAAGADQPLTSDNGRFRSLLPATESAALAGTLNRTLFGDVSASFNGRVAMNSSESRLGLAGITLIVPETSPFSPFSRDVSLFRYDAASGPLARRSRSQSVHAGLGLNGDIQPWRWTFTANYDRSHDTSRTDAGTDPAALQAQLDAGDAAINPFGPLDPALLAIRPDDRSRTDSESADAQLVVNGPLFDMPAGRVRASGRIGGDFRGIDSRSVRSGVVREVELSRRRVAAQGSVDIPITDRARDVFGEIGSLDLNLNAELEYYSDFGTLRTWGGGLRWSPIEAINLAASINHEEGAPSIQQLGNPVILTPNVRVFDFTRGETVDISRLDGGNPDLRADDRRVLNLRFSARPFSDRDLNIIANYTDSRTVDPIASFPAVTAAIEAAFPDRVIRDATGRLIQLDARPINFARADRAEVRWGINFSKPIGPQGPTPEQRARFREMRRAGGGQAGATGAPGTATPGDAASTPGQAEGRRGRGPGAGGFGGRGPGGGGFGGRGFGGGGNGGRLQFALFHTWRLEDRVLIRPGVPEIDFLDGAAEGSRGGRPRHEMELQAGIFRNGFGARLSGNWQSSTFVDGSAGGQGDLFFSDFASLNLRLFADLNQRRSLVRRYPILRGTRISLSVDNLLDTRLSVRDQSGATPLGYQPDLLDPLGRSVRLSIRKLFF